MPTKIAVHDPRGYPPVVAGKRLAQRLENLNGKTVYLVDCLFDNSEVFMNELKDWFGKHIPSLKTVMIKPRESWIDDPAMRAVVSANADAAILGVGL